MHIEIQILLNHNLTNAQHAPGVLVGNDKIPEFEAKVLPAGSAPADKTFKPQNDLEVPPVGMEPGDELHEASAPTVGGTTSADVHTGLGKPIDGQSSSEQHNNGKTHRARENQGLQGQAEGGSGLHEDDSAEARRLQSEHQGGVKTGREHNISLDGAESKEGVGAEEVAAMGQKSRKEDYDRSSYTAQGGPNA